jgi:hypothetical protein
MYDKKKRTFWYGKTIILLPVVPIRTTRREVEEYEQQN